MTLHDRIMGLIPDDIANGGEEFYDGFAEASRKAAALAKEADELMAEMAEALVIMDWFFVDDGSERKRKIMEMQKKVINTYNTYKESKQ